jgi:hypothetical protein
MAKGLLQLIGFAVAGWFFFAWFVGHMQSREHTYQESFSDYPTAQANAGPYSSKGADHYTERENNRTRPAAKFKQPTPLESYAREMPSADTYETAPAPRATRASAERAAIPVRDWKGAHRDTDFARICHERFGEEIAELSTQYGLYPQVFMARVIAYSYEFLERPGQDIADFNLTAMKQPNGPERARFRSAKESLRAYATVNAGEVKRLSADGALAKHDRAWTMRKIIENNRFVAAMGQTTSSAYEGYVGPANEVSSETNHKREVVGEAVRIVSSVDNSVKKRRAKEAGFDSWEEYLESLPKELRDKQEESASAVISAVSKKKSMNLSRRVEAKKQRIK